MELIGSKTEANLRSAISGESQAAILYEFFAKRAKKDGFESIASIFRETADNEKAHAKIYLDLLDCLHTTDKNLFAAAKAEKHENTKMYPEFARVAREEGFEAIAATFEMVGRIEAEHEKRFQKLGYQVENGAVFSKGMETEWICTNCGHRHTGTDAPGICPVCKHPMAFFETIPKEDN